MTSSSTRSSLMSLDQNDDQKQTTNTNDDAWKNKIRIKLIILYEAEDCARILWYLWKQEEEEEEGVKKKREKKKNVSCLSWRMIRIFRINRNRTKNNNHNLTWTSLRDVLDEEKKFESIADQMLAITLKNRKKDKEFCQTMKLIYSEMKKKDETDDDDNDKNELPENDMKSSNTNSTKIAGQKKPEFDLGPFDPSKLEVACISSGFIGYTYAISQIPLQFQKQIIEQIPNFARNLPVIKYAEQVGKLTHRVGGRVAVLGLAAIIISWETIKNIRLWWLEEIPGELCCKNILDSIAAVCVSVAGSVAGAAIGTFVAGPIGTVVGSMAGGYFGSIIGSRLSDHLTEKLFGVTKDVALNNAYAYFGVPVTASNAEINTAYRRACLTHHPDKREDGDGTEFNLIQINMAVIKAARSDL